MPAWYFEISGYSRVKYLVQMITSSVDVATDTSCYRKIKVEMLLSRRKMFFFGCFDNFETLVPE